MKMAVDAPIMLRNHARRMVLGAAEVGRWDVVLPTTAAVMAKLHCARVAKGYVTKKIEWDIELSGREISDEALGLLIHDQLEKVSAGFGQWLDSEPLRNDRVFEIGERTRRAQGVAMELDRAGVVQDRKDTRWEVGEDPYVLAEALEAGAHWIASGNFSTLKSGPMERWLDRVQAQGRFTHVPRPFILDPETAVLTMLKGEVPAHQQRYEDEELTNGLAHALSKPKEHTGNLKRRVAILTRLANDLIDAGMADIGGVLNRWCIRAAARNKAGRESETWEEIEKMGRIILTEEVRRTREAEDRRMTLEENPEKTRVGRTLRTNTSSGKTS